MEEKTKIERKNNKSVKTAVLLFGAVLITMSLLGGTLAKYTSDIGTASDSARVAKWYVSETVSDFDLFADSYLDEGAGNTKGAWDADNKTNKKNTVQGDTEGTKVIAPGTKGSATIQIDANNVEPSEVAFKYVYAIDGSDDWSALPFYRNGSDPINMQNPEMSIKGWNVLKDSDPAKGYNGWLPLRFKITKGGSVIYDGFNSGDDGQVQVVKLRDMLKSNAETSIIYPKSTAAEIGTVVTASALTIDWDWPFEISDKFDAADTAVAKNAASGVDVPNFVIPISVKKVQVD